MARGKYDMLQGYESKLAGTGRKKYCRRCLEVKPINMFGPSKRDDHNYDYFCLACRKEIKKRQGWTGEGERMARMEMAPMHRMNESDMIVKWEDEQKIHEKRHVSFDSKCEKLKEGERFNEQVRPKKTEEKTKRGHRSKEKSACNG